MLLDQSINSYFNKNQKAVLLSIVHTAIESKPKKSVKLFVAYGVYLKICQKLRLRCSDENEFWTELKVIELAGFIKVRSDSIGGIGANNYSLEEIQDAIYQDPEFEKVKAGEQF
jgi:Cdc6-like AAA superfamily ATPase